MWAHFAVTLYKTEHDARISCVSFVNEFIVNYFVVCTTTFKLICMYARVCARSRVCVLVFFCSPIILPSQMMPLQLLLSMNWDSISLAKGQICTHCCRVLSNIFPTNKIRFHFIIGRNTIINVCAHLYIYLDVLDALHTHTHAMSLHWN